MIVIVVSGLLALIAIFAAVSTRGNVVHSACAKPHCACKDTPPQLHGPYYRWTGFIKGKRTTKSITPEQARECKRRIRNFRALEKQLRRLVRYALQHAPWKERPALAPEWPSPPQPISRGPRPCAPQRPAEPPSRPT